MAKKKTPAPKRSGKKKVAPKKATRSKPIPQQMAEQSARKRAADKASALPHVDVSAQPRQEQFEKAQREASVFEQLGASVRSCEALSSSLPAPPPPGPKSKFWRQYQDESGKFIGFRKALTKTKDQVISRLVLRRRPKRAD